MIVLKIMLARYVYDCAREKGAKSLANRMKAQACIVDLTICGPVWAQTILWSIFAKLRSSSFSQLYIDASHKPDVFSGNWVS